jgi:hypothetical protein
VKSINVFVEIGKKKTFAGALEWPGWCRSSRDENAALQALIEYGSRYAQVLQPTKFDFQIPQYPSDLLVVERQVGNATTDFGAPAILWEADRGSIDPKDFGRFISLLSACWQAFDLAVKQAANRELRKGPRGGGRDLDTILRHVLEAEREYLKRLAWKPKKEVGGNFMEQLEQTRQEILNALEVAAKGELPAHGPRGGVVWPLRFFVRRVAWHVLDHAWEIEDRME